PEIMRMLNISGMLICIFTPNYYFFKMGTRFAVPLMLGYLLFGLLLLILKQQRLMFTSFACCAGMCLFLKFSSDAELRFPTRTSRESLKVAHFNVANSGEDYENTIRLMLSTDADLISIQEIDPHWSQLLLETLNSKYPYHHSVVRFDPFGLALFSKHRFHSIDTFHFEDIPNIIGSIQPPGFKEQLYFISSHTTPPLYSSAYNRLSEHLEKIAQYTSHIKAPILTFGDYYAPPWWGEIQNLKEAGQLSDSRPSGLSDLSNVFQNPVDYIFYSKHFNCIDFENITQESNHLGISGTYQSKPDYFHVKTPNQ
ncbi:MAG: endonuclease/exonuclease/phosphatase family protein, partial [Bacteroidota bacterium]